MTRGNALYRTAWLNGRHGVGTAYRVMLTSEEKALRWFAEGMWLGDVLIAHGGRIIAKR